MASNAAPPGLGNAVGNAPTLFPHPTSARTHADLSAEMACADHKIACADKKIADTAAMSACADEKMEGAGAKMEGGRAKSASAASSSAGKDGMLWRLAASYARRRLPIPTTGARTGANLHENTVDNPGGWGILWYNL